jgi:hypothetical protein
VARCIDDDGELVADDKLTHWMRHRRERRDGSFITLGVDECTTFAALALENWVVTPGTQLIRREVLDRVGLFDEATAPGDDWDMAIRVSRSGPVGFIDRPLLNWRRHPLTITNTSPHWRRAYFRVRTKMLVDPLNTPEQTGAARDAYVDVCRSAWQSARERAGQHHYSQAARQLALAMHRSALYSYADLRRRRGAGR